MDLMPVELYDAPDCINCTTNNKKHKQNSHRLEQDTNLEPQEEDSTFTRNQFKLVDAAWISNIFLKTQCVLDKWSIMLVFVKDTFTLCTPLTVPLIGANVLRLMSNVILDGNTLRTLKYK